METTSRLRADVFESFETTGTALDAFLDETPQFLDADRISLSLSAPFLDRAKNRVSLARIFAAPNRGRYLGRQIIWEREMNDTSAHPTLPSSEIEISFCASTANSIGSCCSTSRTKPFTISAVASSADSPRC